jgi:CheY-like chemotaxis protein
MKYRVLIIDDDVSLNKINEKVLLGSGLVSEVHIVSNGLLGLEYIVSRVNSGMPLPQFIILDLQMPVMDGFTFLQEYESLEFAEKTRIQVIVFTSSSNPRDREKARAKGVRHFLSKPYLLRGLQDIFYQSYRGSGTMVW